MIPNQVLHVRRLACALALPLVIAGCAQPVKPITPPPPPPSAGSIALNTIADARSAVRQTQQALPVKWFGAHGRRQARLIFQGPGFEIYEGPADLIFMLHRVGPDTPIIDHDPDALRQGRLVYGPRHAAQINSASDAILAQMGVRQLKRERPTLTVMHFVEGVHLPFTMSRGPWSGDRDARPEDPLLVTRFAYEPGASNGPWVPFTQTLRGFEQIGKDSFLTASSALAYHRNRTAMMAEGERLRSETQRAALIQAAGPGPFGDLSLTNLAMFHALYRGDASAVPVTRDSRHFGVFFHTYLVAFAEQCPGHLPANKLPVLTWQCVHMVETIPPLGSWRPRSTTCREYQRRPSGVFAAPPMRQAFEVLAAMDRSDAGPQSLADGFKAVLDVKGNMELLNQFNSPLPGEPAAVCRWRRPGPLIPSRGLGQSFRRAGADDGKANVGMAQFGERCAWLARARARPCPPTARNRVSRGSKAPAPRRGRRSSACGGTRVRTTRMSWRARAMWPSRGRASRA